MSEERVQGGPDHPWEGKGRPDEYRPLFPEEQPSSRILQVGPTGGRFLGCHDRSLEEKRLTTAFRQRIIVPWPVSPFPFGKLPCRPQSLLL